MKIDFESRARAPRGGGSVGGEWRTATRGGGAGGEDRGGVGVVKTLVSRPGIRVSRHNAGALIDRARDQPAPKATRLFFNVRELKKLINDVMRPHGRPGRRKRGAARRPYTGLRRERASQNRAYLLTERPLLVLCVFQMTAARLENIVRRSSVVSLFFFLSFVKIATVT